MRHALSLHPDYRSTAATAVEAEAVRDPSGGLALRYALTGLLDALRIPPVTFAGRRDELWRHTCFEAFVSAPSLTGYYELNFSPSTEWAAYRFDAYREGMRPAEITAPRIATQRTPDTFILQATLAADDLRALPHNAAWQVGLTAVIEDARADKSYWALAHPEGKPDFHNPDCFALQLLPASRA